MFSLIRRGRSGCLYASLGGTLFESSQKLCLTFERNHFPNTTTSPRSAYVNALSRSCFEADKNTACSLLLLSLASLPSFQIARAKSFESFGRLPSTKCK